MLQGWVVIAVALGYIGLLFLVASYGDRVRRLGRDSRARLLIYPLSLAIYCTSWTFFGSVGSASRSGYEFLAIYVGPVLMIGLFAPMIARVVRLAKAQNITSIADFIAARYGKSQAVAATVALIAIIGTVPYIALQLKAVSFSLETIIAHTMPAAEIGRPLLGDMALYVALSMALFAVLFGTRHIDATEHQDGLMLAVAAESIVKLLSFLAVGIFVTFWMFDGPVALFSKAMNSPLAASVLTREPPLRHSAGEHAAVVLRDPAAAAAIPRRRRREQRRTRDQARALDVSDLSRADQPVRGADRDRRPDDLPGRPGRRRHVRAGAAAAGRIERLHHPGLRRRPVGRDRHGDRRDGRARHHGVERHRRALGAAAARGADHRPRGRRLAAAHRAADRDLRDPAVRLHVLPLRRRFPACRDRHPGLRRHRAARAGVLRRPDLAATPPRAAPSPA